MAESDDTTLRPFEWLTSSQSVIPILESLNLNNNSKVAALHLGCGSSTLGESMVLELGFEFVLNVDKDPITLDRMRQRWKERFSTTITSSATTTQQQPQEEADTPIQGQRDLSQALEYRVLDFSKIPPLPSDLPNSPYPLIVEKSTLDCTLCDSIQTTAGLLSLVYQHLAVDGYYVLISFRSLELLVPLLQDLPGAQWTVSHREMSRHVEDFNIVQQQEMQQHHHHPVNQLHNTNTHTSSSNVTIPATSSSVTVPISEFSLTNHTINVLICHKSHSLIGDKEIMSTLDFNAIQEHIVTATNVWYQTLFPFLNKTRIRELEHRFGIATTTTKTTCTTENDDDDNIVSEEKDNPTTSTTSKSLSECYQVLFTEEERQDLTYDHFLEDWYAYLETHPNCLSTTEMTFEIALDFLKEMQ